MQVTEAVANGLKRELQVVVPKGDIDVKFNDRVNNLKGNMQLPGFRKGKVPATHIKKVYGRSIMAEVLQEALNETSQKAITDRKERPAFQPKIDMTEDKDEIEKVFAGQSDLAYKMSFEVLPAIALTDFSQLKLEKAVVAVSDEEIDQGLKELAERGTKFDTEEGRAAEDGDQVTIDFVGKIDGEAFEGGTGTDVPVVLGRGGFIPGFEDGLKGTKAGDQRAVEATFPVAYPEKKFAGKTAIFDTVIKSVAKSTVPAIDDDLAKSLGLEDLTRLRDIVKAQIQGQYDQLSRTKLKRELLDQLDTAHTFDLPQTLVDNEFEGIWKQVTDGLEKAKKTFADEGKTEEGAREEYRKISERRVRLGLVIGEVGDKAKIQVTQDELRRSLLEQTRRFPGQEQMIYDFYDKNPGALTELRAPIFEDKVIDHIVGIAKPIEKIVTKQELVSSAQEAEMAG